MKKYVLQMRVTENNLLHENYCLLKLTSDDTLPDMLPGQFVEVLVDQSPTTFLRRPLSIHYVDRGRNELWLLIQFVGEGTRSLGRYRVGDPVNVIAPLGNGFTVPDGLSDRQKLLLVGGGAGVAPMLFLGAYLKERGGEPLFLLGARSGKELIQLDDFRRTGKTYVTTEDHSSGEKGYVTDHSILKTTRFDRIYACGPKPMMEAVARYAASASVPCEVSLENTMACGIGACLCCVEDTKEGHLCVCTDGPVFNIERLRWLN
ncbi:MAG: dihydroorotate dehydrogenase electron transfer subunit [Tannerellaceae bacterium]|jgi:dihydroorotate dehydrogenase electron transfer subunit|nr:dihydroorotate dehydrogenase electron transfer subunit [Tannerellaceae bacterium]